MYRKIEDFRKDWAHEAESTKRVFQNLTDESLSQRVTEEGRSLGFLAWHLTTTLREMLGHAGIEVNAPPQDSEVPQGASEIVLAYEEGALSVSHAVASAWTDEELTDEIPMYGEPWMKGIVLHALVSHQTHHRGQITVLMRQAGSRVPGVYGPSKEEWTEYGMPAMA